MGADHVVHATLLDLLHPYALLGGLVTLTLFLTHGANFLALRTTGDVRDRAKALAQRDLAARGRCSPQASWSGRWPTSPSRSAC